MNSFTPVSQSIHAPADVTSVNWVPVVRNLVKRGPGNLFPDMMMKACLTVKPHPKNGTVKRELVFRMHETIAKEMGWEYGDNILVCYDADDVHSMMLIKHGNGNKLQREGGSKSPSKVMRLPVPASFITCDAFGSTVQVYRLDKANKRLFVRLKTEE